MLLQQLARRLHAFPALRVAQGFVRQTLLPPAVLLGLLCGLGGSTGDVLGGGALDDTDSDGLPEKKEIN